MAAHVGGLIAGIPKTMQQVRRVGWALLLPALFIATVGLLFTIGALTGAVT